MPIIAEPLLSVVVSVFFYMEISSFSTSIYSNNKEQDIEITAVKLKLIKKNIIVACVYRAPTGNMDYFL